MHICGAPVDLCCLHCRYLEDVSPGAGGYGFLQVVLVSSKGLKKTASPYCEITLTNSPGGREKNTRLTDTAEYIPAKEAHVWDGGQMFNLSVTDPFTQKVEVKLCVLVSCGTPQGFGAFASCPILCCG